MSVKLYIISSDDQLECLLRSPLLIYPDLFRSAEEKKERLAVEEFLAAENGPLSGFSAKGNFCRPDYLRHCGTLCRIHNKHGRRNNLSSETAAKDVPERWKHYIQINADYYKR
jgi:hypothetical protein